MPELWVLVLFLLLVFLTGMVAGVVLVIVLCSCVVAGRADREAERDF